MTSARETAMSKRLETAETALQTETASHDRTLRDLHSVFWSLKEARIQIQTLERERDHCREEIEDQRRGYEGRLSRREQEKGEYQAASRNSYLEQLATIVGLRAEVNQLRTEVEESTSNLELMLEQQDELRAEGDAAIKQIKTIKDNDTELQELRGQLALTIASAEEDVKRANATAENAKKMRDFAVQQIKALKKKAS